MEKKQIRPSPDPENETESESQGLQVPVQYVSVPLVGSGWKKNTPTSKPSVFQLVDKEDPVKICQKLVEDNNNMEGPFILNHKNKDCVVRWEL